MNNLASYQSLLKELEQIYQALINKEDYSIALKALELSARLLQKNQTTTLDLVHILNQMTDEELEKLRKQFSLKMPTLKKKGQ